MARAARGFAHGVCMVCTKYAQKSRFRIGRTGLKLHFISLAKTVHAMSGPANPRLDGETLNEFYFVSPPGPPNRSIGEIA